jgi:low affinity Fe/Cu permease
MMNLQKGIFHDFAAACVRIAGHSWSFGLALATILLWAITGPIFGFSDTWQLAINTATTIVTFLMVFLIQNAQNRDNAAVQLKLSELIRATRAAHNAFLDLEELSESELDRVKHSYRRLAEEARKELRAGKADLGSPDWFRNEAADADESDVFEHSKVCRPVLRPKKRKVVL